MSVVYNCCRENKYKNLNAKQFIFFLFQCSVSPIMYESVGLGYTHFDISENDLYDDLLMSVRVSVVTCNSSKSGTDFDKCFAIRKNVNRKDEQKRSSGSG